jgi:hypothetical protein
MATMARDTRFGLPSLYYFGLMVRRGRRVMANQPSPVMAEVSLTKIINNWSRYVGEMTDVGLGFTYHASDYRN